MRHGPPASRPPCAEDIDYRHPRGLDRAVVRRLLSRRLGPRPTRTCCLLGPTGDRQDLAGLRHCADAACRARPHRLFISACRACSTNWPLARADGRYLKLHGRPGQGRGARPRRLGLGSARRRTPARSARDLLDERYQTRSTVVASQLPVAHWHEALGHPTLADAILDRLVHHAHPLPLAGESLRKLQPPLTEESTQE
ncbi:MAG: ATP-binding protein [Chromatiales bacterium]|nr:ATP-binding protein [Chromatiales bacterium]